MEKEALFPGPLPFPASAFLSSHLPPTHASPWEGPKHTMPLHSSALLPVLVLSTGMPSPPPAHPANPCSSFKHHSDFPSTEVRFNCPPQCCRVLFLSRHLPLHCVHKGQGPRLTQLCTSRPCPVFVTKRGLVSGNQINVLQGRASTTGKVTGCGLLGKDGAQAVGASGLDAWEGGRVLLAGPEVRSAKGTSELK